MEDLPRAEREDRVRRFLAALARLDEPAWRAVAQLHFELSSREDAEEARMACRQAAERAGRLAEWKGAGDRAWEESRRADRLKGSGPRRSVHLEARAAARLAAGALVVRDLIGEDRFGLVYAPFTEVVPLP